MNPDTAMRDELKPCPFCGSPAYLAEYPGEDRPVYLFWVTCPDCGLEARATKDKAEAIAAWNRRAPSPAPVGERVEQIARIVDGRAWASKDWVSIRPETRELEEGMQARLDESLAKAAQIAALNHD